MLKLSPRLELIAAKVPEGARICDIGSDHAYLPIYLAQSGKIKSALASDISPSSVRKARRNIARFGADGIVSARRGDGILASPFEPAYTIIISGMGGLSICKILSKGPLSGGERLILQPMTNAGALRAFLPEAGFIIVDEALVKDGGRIYAVIIAQKGGGARYTPLELLLGPLLCKSRGPLFRELVLRHIKRLEKALFSLSKQGEGHEPLRARYESLLGELYALLKSEF